MSTKSWVVSVLAAGLLFSAQALGQVVPLDWTGDEETFAAADPPYDPIDPAVVSSDGADTYLFGTEITLGEGLLFDAEFGFGTETKRLTIAVLTLTEGSPDDVYDFLVDQLGEGEVSRPLELAGTEWVHEVSFVDGESAILYRRSGDHCELVVRPL